MFQPRAGTQTFTGLRAGKYRLYTPGGSPVESVEPIELREGEEKSVEVKLPGGEADKDTGVVSVLVLDERGFVIERADAWLQSGDARHEAGQGNGGLSRFSVPQGEYTLHAGFPGFVEGGEAVVVKPGEAEKPVVVRLKKP